MAPFCLPGQDDWNKVQHAFHGHVMPMLASYDTDGIIKSTAALLVQDVWNEKKHDFVSNLTLLTLASALCDAKATVNRTIVFIRSK